MGGHVMKFTPLPNDRLGEDGYSVIALLDLDTDRTLLNTLGKARGYEAVFAPDGRTFATFHGAVLHGEDYEQVNSDRGDDMGLCLWETASRVEIVRQPNVPDNPEGYPTAVAFSGDGQRLALAKFGGNGSRFNLHVWSLVPRGPRPLLRLPDEVGDASALWPALASLSPVTAWKAMLQLEARPDQAVALLGGRVQLPAAERGAAVTRLLSELDNDRFSVRQAAERKLRDMGRVAEPALRQALDRAAGAEARQRLRGTLTEVLKQPVPGERLRDLRVIEILERIGSPDARAVLEKWAGGPSLEPLTLDARSAIGRLHRLDEVKKR
jgi:hypothetical protein